MGGITEPLDVRSYKTNLSVYDICDFEGHPTVHGLSFDSHRLHKIYQYVSKNLHSVYYTYMYVCMLSNKFCVTENEIWLAVNKDTHS